MKKAAPKSPRIKKSPGKSHPSGARRAGYIVAIVVMIVLIYILRNLRSWGFTFLTEDFGKCLFYIEISIYVSIVAQALFIFYDNRWFKHLVQGIINIAGAVALIMIYVIFPFDIEDGTWIKWIKIGILVIFGITVITIFVELIKGIRDLGKDPEAV
ncbi:MAG: hypothetical protein M0Q51_11225 [Bacteroidales bacterium]|nr:hypothetical protein [Bacteroidales bacterium]